MTPSDIFANSEACGPSEDLNFPSMVGYRIEDDDLYEFKLEYRTIVVASINEMLVLGGSLEYTGDFGGVSEDLEFFDSISDILKDSNGNA